MWLAAFGADNVIERAAKPLPHASKGREAGASTLRGTNRMNAHEQQLQPQSATGPASAAVESENHDRVVSQVRPWVRYWARMLDIYLAALVIGIVIGVFSPRALDVPGSDILFGLALLLIWVFVESLLLSSVGITPGKWLLNTRLVPPSGGKPGFTAAFSRSVKVWWRGLGIGFPIISIITLVIAHGDLKESGSTTWDKDTGFVVVHGRIGFLRAAIAVVAFSLFLALVIIGSVLDA